MIRIINGKIFDPAQGLSGLKKDLCLKDGHIVDPPDPSACENVRVFDAEGCVVMAGAIDIHSHLAGEPLELLRDAGDPIIPTVGEIGDQYTEMGYTAVVNAAMPALSARRTILEERAIGKVDALNLVWVGENPAFTKVIREGSEAELDQYLAWLLDASCGFGLKLINPQNGADGFRETVKKLIEAADRLRLSHPLHLHHPYLAKAGAFAEVIKTMEAAGGMPLHLAHLQFYSYKENSEGKLVSSAAELAEALNRRPNISADVGAVIFGNAAAVSCDTSFVRTLGKRHKKARTELWELDGGMACLPLKYKRESYMGSLQFLAGLELMLRTERPEQMLLTTDHPNGGPYTAYPYLIALLMDSSFRKEELKKLSPKALALSPVPSLDREYTLDEIARLTRTGPAERLGTPLLGHLKSGALSGAAVYREQADRLKMFSRAEAVFKGENAVFAASKRPYDPEFVRSIVSPYIDIPFEEAVPDETFRKENRVTRGCHIDGYGL